jgi:hypothetical protein
MRRAGQTPAVARGGQAHTATANRTRACPPPRPNERKHIEKGLNDAFSSGNSAGLAGTFLWAPPCTAEEALDIVDPLIPSVEPRRHS